jgi:SAM-dependent methyltransferase
VTTIKPFTLLAKVYDTIFADVEYQEWAEFILQYLEKAGFNLEPSKVRILDLACGTASSSAPYLERGYSVVGVDASKEMLEQAQLKFPEIRFVQQGFTTLNLSEKFELVTCVFDSLNNLIEPSDLEKTFLNIAKHLVPGGWLAFDINTRQGVRELWEDDRFEGEIITESEHLRFSWTHDYDASLELGIVSAHCKTDKLEFTETHYERGYDPNELEPMLMHAGFGFIEFLEFPDFVEPEADSPRIWCFARI